MNCCRFSSQGSSKLEKAEILQMTVDHLKLLHAMGGKGGGSFHFVAIDACDFCRHVDCDSLSTWVFYSWNFHRCPVAEEETFASNNSNESEKRRTESAGNEFNRKIFTSYLSNGV